MVTLKEFMHLVPSNTTVKIEIHKAPINVNRIDNIVLYRSDVFCFSDNPEVAAFRDTHKNWIVRNVRAYNQSQIVIGVYEE